MHFVVVVESIIIAHMIIFPKYVRDAHGVFIVGGNDDEDDDTETKHRIKTKKMLATSTKSNRVRPNPMKRDLLKKKQLEDKEFEIAAFSLAICSNLNYLSIYVLTVKCKSPINDLARPMAMTREQNRSELSTISPHSRWLVRKFL